VIRLCFIGNSHLGAIKAGWNISAENHPGVSAQFFGAPQSSFVDTKVENGRLVAKSERAQQMFRVTSGGSIEVVPGDYDLIVFVGLSYSHEPLLDLYESYRGDDQGNPEGDFQLVSTSYFIAMCKSRLSRIAAIDYRAQMLAAGTPIWIYPTPMPGENAPNMQSESQTPTGLRRFALLQQAARWGDGCSLFDIFASAGHAFEREGIVVFEQPAETRVSGIFTRGEFNRNAPHVAALAGHVHDQGNFSHMNADYGAIVIRQILERWRGGAGDIARTGRTAQPAAQPNFA
jgi:hypothetical protein